MKKSADKATIKTTVNEAAVLPKNNVSSSSPINLSLPAKIAIGIGLGIIAIAGVLYNRYWNIATVNGKSISRLAYYQELEKQAGKSTLDNMITESLITTAAEKNKVSVSQAEIDAQLSKIESQVKTQGMTIDQALAQQGMTKNDLITQIKLQSLVQTLGKGTVQVTDQQVSDYITKNKSSLPTDKKPEELQQLVKDTLTQQAENKNVQTWLQQIRSSAEINYY